MGRAVVALVKDRRLVRDRRRQLVRAAMAAFVRKGYHQATVRDIGREAGFTQGTIYDYVRSKADILYLVCDEVVTAYHDAVRRTIAEVHDPRRRIQAALRAVVEVMQEREEQILLLYHESHALDRRALRAILARVEEFIRTFEDMLAAARPPVGAGAGGLRLLANIVTFLPTMVALRRWDLRRYLARAEVAEGLSEFMVRGLGLGPGRRRPTVPRAGARA